ncbi:FHA domain-containing protein [Mycobacterium sp. LTG2003]
MGSDEALTISVDVDHNPYLADGAGTVDAIVSVRATTGRTSMDMPNPDLRLRLWTPAGAGIEFVKQVAPTVEDLTCRRIDADDRTGEYPLGSRVAEDRDYHIRIEVQPAAVGREKLAARVSVVAGDQVLGEGLVRAVWTADTALSAVISRRVGHYTGTAKLLDKAIERGERTGTAQLSRQGLDEMALDACSANGTVGWIAVVVADREFYERVLARGGPDIVEFPSSFPERRITLRDSMLIGRRNRDQGVEPAIDLGTHPADRGVSTRHALLRCHENSVTVTDLGSTNGTTLNESDDRLGYGEEVSLTDGDRIHVGAWTTITIRQAGAPPPAGTEGP